MCRTIHSLLLLTLTLVVGVVASAGAQSDVTPSMTPDVTPGVTPDVTRVSGMIQEVDPIAGRFTLQSTAGTLTELHAPPALLSTLQTGDVVEVMMAGSNAMILRRQASGPPPAAGETLPPQEEAETPRPSPSDESRQ
jgi:hypothetical protein